MCKPRQNKTKQNKTKQNKTKLEDKYTVRPNIYFKDRLTEDCPGNKSTFPEMYVV